MRSQHGSREQVAAEVTVMGSFGGSFLRPWNNFIRGVLMMKIVDISSVFGCPNISLSLLPSSASLPPSRLFVPGAAGAVDGDAAGGVGGGGGGGGGQTRSSKLLGRAAGRQPGRQRKGCLAACLAVGSEKAGQPTEQRRKEGRTMTFLAKTHSLCTG